MNIIIPLGGLGKRFADEGFTDPKPLIFEKISKKVFGICTDYVEDYL